MSEVNTRFSLEVRKWDVVDTLRRRYSLRSYLQILSVSTGPDMLTRPELSRFGSMTTLMYASELQRDEIPEAADLPCWREIEDCYRRNPQVVDLVFIDNWHSYEDSRSALLVALQALRRGGFIVMHDCDPPDWEAANPEPESCTSLYCGEAWRAFVDVAHSLDEGANWYVVESDLGIGVISVPPWSKGRLVRRYLVRQAERLLKRPLPSPVRRHVPAVGAEAWSWFVEHRVESIHPLSIDSWKRFAETGAGTRLAPK